MKTSFWTKALLTLAVFAVFFAAAADDADARRGRFVAPKKTYTEQPKKMQDGAGTVNRSDSGTTSGTKAGANPTGTAGTQRGSFGGGSFLKGLMIGGLAGFLFGSLFAHMGFLGELLGLMINLLAIYFLFVLVRAAYRYFRDRKPPRPHETGRRY
jgi:predicted lipid-binding transport protein (Tim44 family)